MARKPKVIETPGDVTPAETPTPAAKLVAKLIAEPEPTGEMLYGRRVLDRRWGMVLIEGIGWVSAGAE